MFVHDQIDANERFRERRRRARRRRRIRGAIAAAILTAAAVAIPVAVFVGSGDGSRAASRAPAAAKQRVPLAMSPRAWPTELRGVHVTMALASVQGKLDGYLTLARDGLNTIQLDVKDENGHVGFTSPRVPLAVTTGAAQPYYDARAAARKVHAAGLYLIGRVVVFEDPVISQMRPEMAIRNPDGSVWHTAAGLGWTNQYDRRVWMYNVDVAVAAARAGFDEIQFDYVRFPSDGNVDAIVYPGKRMEPKGTTIVDFLTYATKRLRPLGVRVSADVFGLAAKHDLHIGQVPKRMAKVLDAIYPMVYPSHYASGEYNISDPNAYPGATVGHSLRDFNLAVKGGRAKLIPWLQDFTLGGRTYTLLDVQQQIDAARAQGVRGYLLWNPLGVYTSEALASG